MINFTVEKGSNNILSSLDVKIIRENNGNLFSDVYRKFSYNNFFLFIAIQTNIHQLNGQSLGLFFKALRFCSPHIFYSKINIILNIGHNIKKMSCFLDIYLIN